VLEFIFLRCFHITFKPVNLHDLHAAQLHFCLAVGNKGSSMMNVMDCHCESAHILIGAKQGTDPVEGARECQSRDTKKI